MGEFEWVGGNPYTPCPKCGTVTYINDEWPTDTMIKCISCNFKDTMKYWKLPEHIQLWTDKLKEMK